MSLIDEYTEEKVEFVGGIKRAVPKPFDYRERFKRKRLTYKDIAVSPKRDKIVMRDPGEGEFSRLSGSAGYSAFFGEGFESEDI